MAKPVNRRARDVKPPRLPPTEEQLARARFIRRATLHALFAIVFVGGIAWAVGELRQVVAARTDAAPPAIVFVNRPAWMTDLVAGNLAATFRPATGSSVFDREQLVEVNRQLKANPWVSHVRGVRRVFGEEAGDRIEIDCDFRTPVALVSESPSRYWFVDAEGVKLPEWFDADQLKQVIVTPDKRVNLRIIDGVAHPPPAQAGQVWQGDDLVAGIDLARLLQGLPYAEEITCIDVSNYGNRENLREAQIVLVTQYGTKVRWGTAINRSDRIVEVTVQRKLNALQQIVSQFGRVDAGQPWIDIRFETVTYPASPATQAGAHADTGR